VVCLEQKETPAGSMENGDVVGIDILWDTLKEIEDE